MRSVKALVESIHTQTHTKKQQTHHLGFLLLSFFKFLSFCASLCANTRKHFWHARTRQVTSPRNLLPLLILLSSSSSFSAFHCTPLSQHLVLLILNPSIVDCLIAFDPASLIANTTPLATSFMRAAAGRSDLSTHLA